MPASKIRMSPSSFGKKHRMSIWSSTSNRGGQWATIWQYCLLNILLRVKNQEPVFNILLFSKQWVSEGKKQNPIECTKEKVGRSKKKVGRWAVGSLIGLQNDIQTTNKSYSFHPCLWNGGRYSNWNRHAYHQNGHIRSKRWQWRTRRAVGLGRWGTRKHSYPDGFLSPESYCSLRKNGLAMCLSDRNPSPQKSLREHGWSSGQEVSD